MKSSENLLYWFRDFSLNHKTYIKSFTRKVAAAIRVVGGRKSVEPNLAENLHTRNHLLDDLFSAHLVKMEEKKKKKDESDIDTDDEVDGTDGSISYVEKVGVGFI